MFKLRVSPTYFHTVTSHIPTGNGAAQIIEFDAEFKRLSLDELQQLQAGVREGRITDRQIIDQVLKGWRNVGDDEGNPLPFVPQNLETLLGIVPIQSDLVGAFFASFEVEKAKN